MDLDASIAKVVVDYIRSISRCVDIVKLVEGSGRNSFDLYFLFFLELYAGVELAHMELVVMLLTCHVICGIYIFWLALDRSNI